MTNEASISRPSWEEVQEHIDHVSHELRAPLAVVMDFADLVRDAMAGPVTEKQVEFLNLIKRRAEGMLRLLDDVLDVSRWQAGAAASEKQSCGVAGFMEEARQVLEPHALAKSQRLECRVPPGTPAAYCDQQQISRVIINLGMNAIKFAPRGGRVSIEVGRHPSLEQIVVRVRDDGPGLTAKQQAVIFRRFHQAQPECATLSKGFGLGLHIANQLVHLHGGMLEVESRPGQGCQFSFSIPMADESSLSSALIRSQQAHLHRDARRLNVSVSDKGKKSER